MLKIFEPLLMKSISRCGTLFKEFKINKILKKIIVECDEDNVDFVDGGGEKSRSRICFLHFKKLSGVFHNSK